MKIAPLAVLALLASVPVLADSRLEFGASWYPEQWPQAQWGHDLDKMKAAGFTVVRVGEFAWSSMEPSEGHYQFAWLEEAVKEANAHGIRVVIGTPTDAPPAWLTSRYPETLRIDETGKRLEHGMRRQFSYASLRYRVFCQEIAEQLVEHFGKNPGVIGWQIDNEYTDDSYDPDARNAFHAWLKEKYESLDALNARWGTQYWSQSYDTWEEIPMGGTRGNPGLMLDYKRFVTSEWQGFQRNQIDAIRPQKGAWQFVTTNLGGLGWADKFNRKVIAADMDMISWDEYVGQGHLDPYKLAATHDLVRGWRNQPFWVMEAQPGFVDWAPISNCLDPGETRQMAWEAIGHGANAVLFWQWRAGLNGQEQFHGTLVGADGEPVPFYAEAAQLGREFAKASPALAGTAPVSQVAIVHDYDSRWSIELHPQNIHYDVVDVILDYYRPLRDLAQSVDIVGAQFDPGHYAVVAAPDLAVLPEDTAKALLHYVQEGGTLLIGPRTGVKDAYNALDPRLAPGPLADALGAKVRQSYALLDPVSVDGPLGHGEASLWAEQLEPVDTAANVELTYGPENGWLAGKPAVMSRAIGKGHLVYIGALLEPALLRQVLEHFLDQARVQPALPGIPSGVEVCRRVGPKGTVYILLNQTKSPVRIRLPSAMRDVLGDKDLTAVDLDRYGVAVLSQGPTTR